jgi:hypothetical protein
MILIAARDERPTTSTFERFSLDASKLGMNAGY